MSLESNSVPRNGPWQALFCDPLSTAGTLALLAMAAVTGIAYVVHIPEFLFPWDDGSMAQMAERVLAGELPHRDFSDTYSGLLNYWHALLFSVGPVDFLTLRVALVACFFVAMTMLFTVLRRSLGIHLSLLIALSASLYGPVVYAGPMPSWYNLILAFYILFVLKRYYVTGTISYLAIAGVLAGVSVCIKITGLYAVAGALVFITHCRSFSNDGFETRRVQGVSDRIFFLGLHGVFLSGVSAILWLYGSLAAGFLIGLPAVLLAAGLCLHAFRYGAVFPLKPVLIFVAATIAPVLLAVTAYWVDGSLASLIDGVLVRPVTRVDSEATSGPLMGLSSLALGAACSLGLFVKPSGVFRPWFVIPVLAAAWLVCVVLAGGAIPAYLQIWGWLRLAPLVVCAYVFLHLVRFDRQSPPEEGWIELFLVASFLSFIPLIQVPFPHGIYVLYFAPLAIAGWMMAQARSQPHGSVIGGVSLVGLALASLIWFQNADLRFLGSLHQPVHQEWAGLDRATLKIKPAQREAYTELMGILKQLNASGKKIYAGPDSPEVLFLAGAQHWHPALYDMFEPLYNEGVEGFERSLEQGLLDGGVEIAVFNLTPAFSRRLSEGLLTRQANRFGNYAVVANHFLVVWKQPD